jgi:hypothetical protein
MTRDDIIRMAREAGFADGVVDIVGFEGFANFAALVAAHEREECAKLCDKESEVLVHYHGCEWNQAHDCAEAIRVRGKK